MLSVYINTMQGGFDISLINCLSLSTLIFFLGLFGVYYNRKNLLLVLVCLELLFLAGSLNFFFFAVFMKNPIGYVYGILIITVAAVESVIGLSLLVLLHRTVHAVSFSGLTSLRG